MQIGQEYCLVFGHEQFKVTHICILSDCDQTYRKICHKCLNEQKHYHYNSMKINYHIQIENFQQFIEDEKLPWIDLRLKSQDENQAKLKYISKIYEETFDDLEWLKGVWQHMQIFLRVKQIIQDLIKEYKYEIVKAQYLNDIYKQLTQHGQESLDIDQLNILLDNHYQHINQEMEYYRELNEFSNKNDANYSLIKKEHNEKFNKIFSKMRKMNQFLYFQMNSTNGKQFRFYQEEFLNTSFSSENERYFAMVTRKAYYCKYLKIRKQNDLLCTQSLYMTTIVKNIKFDPLFNHCIILDQSNIFYHYILRNNKQLKLIQKFSLEIEAKDFFLSKQNNLIILHKDKILVMNIYIKNVYINEIEFTFMDIFFNFQFEYCGFCYGSERSIIAVQNKDLIQIYQETQKQPFLCQFLATEWSFVLKFVNKDTQLLTITRLKIYLWQIEYDNFQLTLINKIVLDLRSEYYINTIEFNIIKQTNQIYELAGFQIFYNKGNQSFQFKIDYAVIYRIKFMEMTKHFLILSSQVEGSQIIKRKNITENVRFKDDY